MSNLPIERTESDIEKSLLLRHYKQPDTDSDDNSDSDGGDSTKNNEELEQARNNDVDTFYCNLHKRMFRFSSKQIINHFKEHEREILLLSYYEKIRDSTLVDIYETRFNDALCRDPFKPPYFQDILEIVQVGSGIKKKVIVRISLKVWFTIKNEQPKCAWMSLSNFQAMRGEIGLGNKIKDKGETFIQSLLDRESIRNSGSGWVYLGINTISIKIIKNAQFGCENYELSKKIESLVKNKTLHNPPGVHSCFQKAISQFFKIRYHDDNYVRKSDWFKPIMSFDDIETWANNEKQIKLQIFTLTKKSNQNYDIQPIYLSKQECEVSLKINILAVLNENNNNGHFMLIQNIEKLFRQTKFQGKHKKIRLCQYCYSFQSERQYIVDRHEINCMENLKSQRNSSNLSEDRIKFPSSKTFLRCRNERSRNPPNWIGFLDFETVSQNVDDFDQLIDLCPTHKLLGVKSCSCSFTARSDKIKSLSYHLLILDFHQKIVIFEDFYIQKSISNPDPGQQLAKVLMDLAYAFTLLHQINHPIEMTMEQQIAHMNCTHCELCFCSFSPSVDKDSILKDMRSLQLATTKIPCKTADHLHHKKNKNYLRTLCSKCNLSVQSRRQEIPLFCHNFAKFDHVFLLKYLHKYWRNNVKVLAKGSNNIMSVYAFPFVLKDSLKFLSGSLDFNIELVKKSCIVTCHNCNTDLSCNCNQITFDNYSRNFNTIYDSDLSEVNGKFNRQRFHDNLKKSAFPYSILSSYENLNKMTTFPSYELFYSNIKNQNVKMSEYQTAKQYFEKYCSNMFEFLKIYNRLDCHLLYTCWSAMSTILQTNFELYPENFHTLPSYSFEVAKLGIRRGVDTLDTCIELFDEDNKEIYFKVMDNIRGGVVISNSKFNLNSTLQNLLGEQNSEIKCVDSEELLYIDATNLYGKSLSSLLPYRGYKKVLSSFIEELNNILLIDSQTDKISLLEEYLPDDGARGFAFDIEIINVPENLHEFPPFFAHMKTSPLHLSAYDLTQYESLYKTSFSGSKTTTLLPILDHYDSYFTHFRMMKEAVKLGVNIKILDGIVFDQKYLFKDYLETLSELRSATTNPVYNQALKLQSNSLFGKTLQNPLTYATDYHFYQSDDMEKNLNKIGSKIKERNFKNPPFLFQDIKILDEDFIMTQTQRLQVDASNCPLIAFCILELAKLRNLTFFYKMKKVSPSTKLIYSDTDSFVLACSKTWFSEIREIKEEFDFFNSSEYLKRRLGWTEDDFISAKGQLGRYKLEIKPDSILVGFIAMQKKAYCLLILKEQDCIICKPVYKECKCGSKKMYRLQEESTAKRLDVKQLEFRSYLEALLTDNIQLQNKRKFEQKDKNLFLVHKRYKGLNSFDVSNFTKNCGIHNIPFSNKNLSKFMCNDNFCKNLKEFTLNMLLKFLCDSTEKLFFFSNGKLCSM